MLKVVIEIEGRASGADAGRCISRRRSSRNGGAVTETRLRRGKVQLQIQIAERVVGSDQGRGRVDPGHNRAAVSVVGQVIRHTQFNPENLVEVVAHARIDDARPAGRRVVVSTKVAGEGESPVTRLRRVAGWPGAAGRGCAVGGYDGIGGCATRRYGAAGDFSSRGRLSKTGRCQHCAQQRNQKPMNYIHFSSHKKTGFTVVGGALLA